MNGSRRLIGSFNHGTMANALPHAIGAQATRPGRQVIALAGDGGLVMLLGEIISLSPPGCSARARSYSSWPRPTCGSWKPSSPVPG